MSTRPLARTEAPGLFALLATDAEVLLATDASFSLHGRGGRSVTVGIALLALLGGAELEALLARERASVADARPWHAWSRPGIHRHALAADAKAPDGAALARAIATVALAPRLLRTYFDTNVALAIEHGAVPADLAAGLVVFARRFAERGVTARIRATIETAAPEKNGLPSLGERLGALVAPGDVDAPPDALGLLVFDHAEWLVEQTRRRFETTAPVVPWAEIPARVLAPATIARAAAIAERLAPVVPGATFATVHDALREGHAAAIAATLDPRLATLPEAEARVLVPEVLANALVPLLAAALLAHGATITSILGEEAPRFRYRDATVSPLLLVLAAMAEGPATPGLASWAASLR